ncbi:MULTISPECIES: hypothetical protein [unclassified Halomonas]|uniref:hypothetical protein n=1 Tax=unclassified Halomonas TaxID=2609666 RepID=UPI001E2C0EF9|nr:MULTISPECIES: hypothetical protein [unclassified Halomonas]
MARSQWQTPSKNPYTARHNETTLEDHGESLKSTILLSLKESSPRNPQQPFGRFAPQVLEVVHNSNVPVLLDLVQAS